LDLNPQGRLVWRGSANARRTEPSASWRHAVSEPSKHEIEARAYRLWEEAGCPKDRDAEFWRLAEQQLRNEDKASPTRTPDTL